MLAVAILFLGVFSRLMFHTPNFTPVVALALFGGFYLKKKYAVFLPILFMIITDAFLGWHQTIPFTWGSVALIACLGLWVKNYKSIPVTFGSSLLSAIIFFVVTNFGAWIFMYPHTAEGFVSCYIAAIPFFRNTLISTLLYSVVLFGLYEVMAHRVKDTRFARILLSA